ncbi:MAG: sulfurtransferase TusA family protein [Gammaproteobacteria bacterium]|nr:sulfurtransferase TusA family protein [Gammaproteobacteria bacterium]MCW8987713.1 sulfurtransferase TusA family protein [Gammaproteobacteria bacterium]MCW9031851.1 sulfurtransferase TusA family protein [Gammaproteobacteria bacterium]
MRPPDKILSVIGKSCPLPLIELAKAVQGVAPGQIIQVTGDDPIFDIGVKDFCEAKGFELLELKKDEGKKFIALIKC